MPCNLSPIQRVRKNTLKPCLSFSSIPLASSAPTAAMKPSMAKRPLMVSGAGPENAMADCKEGGVMGLGAGGEGGAGALGAAPVVVDSGLGSGVMLLVARTDSMRLPATLVFCLAETVLERRVITAILTVFAMKL